MFSFCTIIFQDEIELLRLQLKSFDKRVPQSLVDRIVILVNDKNEDDCLRTVHDLVEQVELHKSKIHVYSASEIFGPLEFNGFLREFRARQPWARLAKSHKGWKGNPGWLVQQALKIACGDLVDTPVTVILDAKNIWIRDVVEGDFVSPDGVPKAQFITSPGSNTNKWLGPSYAAIGEVYDGFPGVVTHFVTPFVTHTQLIRDTKARLVSVNGSLCAAFMLRKPHPTEFFSLNATAWATPGRFEKSFSEGLRVCVPFAAAMDEATVDRMFNVASDPERKAVAIHRAILPKMTDQQKRTMFAILNNAGLLETEADMVELVRSVS